MIEILNITNELITIKVINNKKEILNNLGIRPTGANQFQIVNNLFVIKTLLQYTVNQTLTNLYQSQVKDWEKLQTQKQLNDYPGNAKLRHYQRVDVEILKQHPRFGLFNEMRTGKTPTILTALAELQQPKVLFVVPKSTILLTWVPEISKWTNYECIAIKDDPIKVRMQKYQTFESQTNCTLVVSKTTFRNDVKNGLLTKFDFVLVIDEAHFLRNHKTAQTTTLLEVANKVASVYCLTGTPANNHPADVFGILKVIDHQFYQNIQYWDFVERYFGIIKKRISSYMTINLPKPNVKQQLADEFDYLVKRVSIMRKQVDVRNEMPKIIRNDLILEMTHQQAQLYLDVLNGMKNEIFTDKKTKLTFLQIFTKLRVISATPINEESKEIGAKFAWVLDYLVDNDEQDAIIIYSSFSAKGLNILSKLLTKLKLVHRLITGKTPTEERFKAINDFQNGLIKIILCNIKTANVGVTLDRADVMIFLDRDLNPTENEQAENRFFPTQLDDNKTRQIINLYCNNTIDLKVKDLLEQKIDILKIINDQGIKFFE